MKKRRTMRRRMRGGMNRSNGGAAAGAGGGAAAGAGGGFLSWLASFLPGEAGAPAGAAASAAGAGAGGGATNMREAINAALSRQANNTRRAGVSSSGALMTTGKRGRGNAASGGSGNKPTPKVYIPTGPVGHLIANDRSSVSSNNSNNSRGVGLAEGLGYYSNDANEALASEMGGLGAGAGAGGAVVNKSKNAPEQRALNARNMKKLRNNRNLKAAAAELKPNGS